MPNWCSNQVVISGSKEDLNKVVGFLEEAKKNDDGLFNAILPMPDHIKGTTSGSKSPDYNEKGEPITWYSWCREKWGTKWDASDLAFRFLKNGNLEITFQTAWSPALPIIHELSIILPKVNINYRYYELGDGFVGTTIYYGGEIISDECHRANTESMAYHGYETNFFEAMESSEPWSIYITDIINHDAE